MIEAVELQAAVFRRLVRYLNHHRTDVQNIDLMNTAGFCRNCLADWYREAAMVRGLEMDQTEARETIYGMPYEQWKANFQQPTPPTRDDAPAVEARQLRAG